LEAHWKCFRYKDFYLVKGDIYSPILDKWSEVDFILDTGFKGDVFLERRLYDDLKLNLIELPTRLAPIARTMSGAIPLRVAATKLKVANYTFHVKIYTPQYGHGKNLIGRGVANRLILLLEKDRKTCIKLEV